MHVVVPVGLAPGDGCSDEVTSGAGGAGSIVAVYECDSVGVGESVGAELFRNPPVACFGPPPWYPIAMPPPSKSATTRPPDTPRAMRFRRRSVLPRWCTRSR